MGTRGLLVYRLRGRYYATYNHRDSYPTGLGYSVASGIPTDPEEFAGDYRALLLHPLTHPLL